MRVAAEAQVESIAGRPDPGPAALELRNMRKSFGPVQALRGVTVAIRRGEIHAIVGENGAGKSTLLSIAAGSILATSGEVVRDGNVVALPNVGRMRALGVAVAYQHHSLVPDLTVRENLQLVARDGVTRERATTMLRGVASARRSIDPAARVLELTLAETHVVEIARALASDPQIVFFDEPTEPFQQDDVDHLFPLIRELRDRGVAVVYVSHRLHEVMAIADRISIMRDGQVIDSRPAGEITAGEIVNSIAGRPITQVFPPKSQMRGAPVMSVEGVSGPGFAPTDLVARRGEILGLTGVEGEGQRAFLRNLAGLSTRYAGRLLMAGSAVGHGPAAARRAGISFVSDDRHAEGLFLPLAIRENLSLGIHSQISRGGIVDPRLEARRATEIAADLKIKSASIESPITSLSGGNQQKVLIGRELASTPSVIIVDEPTKGVDVGSRSEIYERLRGLADGGAAVLVCSSDGLELEGLCDRVAIFSRGRIVAELAGSEVTDLNITAANLTATAMRSQNERQAPVRRGGWRRLLLSDYVPGLAGMAGIAAILVLMGLVSPFFLSPYNLNGIGLFTAILAFVAIGQLLSMLVGGIDLSVGAVAGISVIVASYLMPADAGMSQLVLGALAILATGATIGLLHGVLIAVLGLPAIVVTLATLIGLQGASLLLRPTPGGMISYALYDAASFPVAGIPAGLLLAAILAVLLELVLLRTDLGRRTRAVGSSRLASLRLGVGVTPITIAAFTGSGLLAALGGILLAGQIGMGSSGIGLDYSIMSIAAVVVGGASVRGGRGSVICTLVGAGLVQLATSISSFLNSDSSVHYVVLGGVTLSAAILSSLISRRMSHDGGDSR